MIKENFHTRNTNISVESINLRQVLGESYDLNALQHFDCFEEFYTLDSPLIESYEIILVNLINLSREKMTKIAVHKGIRHQETIKESQRLYKLIIQYQKLLLLLVKGDDEIEKNGYDR